MRLSIVVDLDAVTPAATERRAVIVAPREHCASAFPLAPFLAHLAETWLPEAQRFRRGDANRYRAAAFPPRALTDQSV